MFDICQVLYTIFECAIRITAPDLHMGKHRTCKCRNQDLNSENLDVGLNVSYYFILKHLLEARDYAESFSFRTSRLRRPWDGSILRFTGLLGLSGSESSEDKKPFVS